LRFIDMAKLVGKNGKFVRFYFSSKLLFVFLQRKPSNMERTQAMYKKVDSLPPIKKTRLAAIERCLCESSNLTRNSHELINALRRETSGKDKFDRSYLQRLIAELNEIYGFCKGQDSSGLNHISRGPNHRLRNTDFLAFPEQALCSSDREKIDMILRIASLFDGAIPLNKILRKTKIKEIDRIVGEATHNAEMDIDTRVTALIERIYEGIENKQVLRFRYPSIDAEKEIRVSPYYIKRYNNKWFLLGKIRNIQYTWSVMALSRIVGDISIETEPIILYEKLKDVKIIKEYYRNVIGFEVPYSSEDDAPKNMSRDNLNILHIEIRCLNDKALGRLKENPIHETQHIYEETHRITLNVIENNVLYNKLMSYGAEIEVISPSEIRTGIADRISAAYQLYQNG